MKADQKSFWWRRPRNSLWWMRIGNSLWWMRIGNSLWWMRIGKFALVEANRKFALMKATRRLALGDENRKFALGDANRKFVLGEANRKFALVAVPAPLQEPLTYAVPEALEGRLEVGMRVLVPLGRRRVTGVVVGFQRQSPVTGIKEVAEALDDEVLLDQAFLEMCRWAADYYVASLGEVLATALPPLLRTESRVVVGFAREPEDFHGPLEPRCAGCGSAGAVPLTPAALSRLFPRRGVKAALDRLGRGRGRDRGGPAPGPRARGSAQAAAPAGKGRRRGGARSRSRAHRGAAAGASRHGTTPWTRAASRPCCCTASPAAARPRSTSRPWSGCAGRAGRALILVPEIALTPQLLDRLEGRFPGDVAVLHSGLTSAERWRHWWRIAQGAVKVVAGARSAVFAPVRELGLIVVDEEHDYSYKQEEGVRYHGRDLAVVRGRIVGCPVILGSATPSVESYHNARSGRYRLLELTERVEARPMPRVEIVNLKTRPGQSAPDGLFSAPLLRALQENHELGRQSLIFLNRRGFRVVPSAAGPAASCSDVRAAASASPTISGATARSATIAAFAIARRTPAPNAANLSLSEVGFGTERGRARVAAAAAQGPHRAHGPGHHRRPGRPGADFPVMGEGGSGRPGGHPDGRQGARRGRRHPGGGGAGRFLSEPP